MARSDATSGQGMMVTVFRVAQLGRLVGDVNGGGL